MFELLPHEANSLLAINSTSLPRGLSFGSSDLVTPEILPDKLSGADLGFVDSDLLTGLKVNEAFSEAKGLSHTYLETALQSAQAKLQQFALSSDVDTLNFVFGTDWNRTVMKTLLTEWQQGNFSNLPQIDLLTGDQLNGANGAYSAETNTIYLSTDLLLNPSNAAEVTNVLLEEIGHAIDSKINATDTPGDEGDLFQRTIQASAIAPEEVRMLKAEDDTAILSLKNRTFLVEQSTVRPFNGTSDGIVNTRRGPGTNHTVVGSLQLNQRVTFDDVATGTTHWDARERINENRWFRIQGSNNWVSAAFITGNPIATPPTPPPSSNTFTGSSDGIVNIRSGPSTNNSIAGTLQLNQRVTFDSVARGTTHWDARERFNDDRWFRIQGTNNWVSAAFITGGPTTGGSTQPPSPSPSGLMATSTFLNQLVNGQLIGQKVDVDRDHGAQCWDLVAYATGISSSSPYWNAGTWKRGENVIGNRNLAVGTAIATFAGLNNTYYGSYNHTGIFAGYDTVNGVFGFYMWEQNATADGAIRRGFYAINGSGMSDADNYFIIRV